MWACVWKWVVMVSSSEEAVSFFVFQRPVMGR